MKFDSSKLELLRSDLNKLLESYGMKDNIEFSIGRITYSDAYCNFSIKAYSKTIGGDLDGRAAEFIRNANVVGIPADWYGKTVMAAGVPHVITGINTRARKFPIIITDATGVSRKATVESTRMLIKI